jgi:hypothetical protein
MGRRISSDDTISATNILPVSRDATSRPQPAPLAEEPPASNEPTIPDAVGACVVIWTREGVRIRTPHISACAARKLDNPNKPGEILLEGRVELYLKTDSYAVRISARRAVINVLDESYRVLPADVEDASQSQPGSW